MENRSGYRDYFKVLEVERNASADEIKKSFRKLARKYHPDVNPGDSNAESRFKEISEAYEVLSDKDKRHRYEQFGQYWNQAGNSNNPGNGFDVDFGKYGNFDEFINELLGRFAGNSSSGFATGFQRGTSKVPVNLDAEVDVKINFTEAFQGSERTLLVNEERVLVRIPAGIKTGARLRLKGKGNLQPGMGRRGDLYLNLQVEPHSVWRIEGDILRADLPVAFDELALGATIKVVTPDGDAQIVVPAGTQPGQNIRLRGKGWPLKEGRGDLIFTMIIKFPESWTEEERLHLANLQEHRAIDPRQSWILSARL